MALYLLAGGDEAPATSSIDMSDDSGAQANNPVWVAFSYWTKTPDATAGGFQADINYTDPTGTNRVINGTPISLADSSAFFSSPVQMVVRESISSAFSFDKTLNGSAGTSEIGYKVMITGNIDENTGPIA